MTSNYNKYLKYKDKYLKLKNQLNKKQLGSGNDAYISELKYSEEGDKDFSKYLKISEVEIEKEHRGKGLSNLLYKALIDYSGNDVKGILSHTPNRINKIQVPKIWKSLGGRTAKFSDDYQIIDINQKLNP